MARQLHIIAQEIIKDWSNCQVPVSVHAKPYLSAMLHLGTLNDQYGMDSARSIVAYFLSNAGTWRGSVARRVKVELRQMLKETRK